MFYSICTPCIFQELFCKQMMYFSIENTIKKKNSTIPQSAGFFGLTSFLLFFSVIHWLCLQLYGMAVSGDGRGTHFGRIYKRFASGSRMLLSGSLVIICTLRNQYFSYKWSLEGGKCEYSYY